MYRLTEIFKKGLLKQKTVFLYLSQLTGLIMMFNYLQIIELSVISGKYNLIVLLYSPH